MSGAVAGAGDTLLLRPGNRGPSRSSTCGAPRPQAASAPGRPRDNDSAAAGARRPGSGDYSKAWRPVAEVDLTNATHVFMYF